ncbi:MAG: hypothetical protein U0527_08290 [Candidatus Eisenbacteria bacterium]
MRHELPLVLQLDPGEQHAVHPRRHRRILVQQLIEDEALCSFAGPHAAQIDILPRRSPTGDAHPMVVQGTSRSWSGGGSAKLLRVSLRPQTLSFRVGRLVD